MSDVHAPIAVPAEEVSVPAAETATAAKAAMPERTGCGENCLNRLSYIHCDTKLCPCGEQCSNRCVLSSGLAVLLPRFMFACGDAVASMLSCRPFHALPQPKMELYLTEDKGWGVKAGEPIVRGTFIVEYAGTHVSTTAASLDLKHLLVPVWH
jgi:hypothetical protein